MEEISQEQLSTINEEDALEDAQQEQLEIQQAQQEDLLGYGSPTPEKKDNQLKLFRDIIDTEDSRKVANLDATELGRVKIGVRSYHSIALFCESQRLFALATYFTEEAEIIQATSMSKKGFFLNTIVTQIKREFKQRIIPSLNKKKWFSKPNPEVEQNEG
ncbi:hypothetical protein LCGC14_0374420 [marine sediment metagenome]|uniref:Uncharacterized protein n=1 Tax=marine sediment metagenome TaxID=412755 RepID=A0A0F9TM96_9ZZZZ